MNYNSKVVSFDRSAAYIHHRAMKNRRENNPVDALELMRQAVEYCPENREYQLDLAEMYCEMGYHEQSNRILLDMLAEKDAPAECYYGLALNQLGRNEIESARRALELYRRHVKDDECMQDADGLSAEMAFLDALKRPLDRRKGRAARIAGRACEIMYREGAEKARRLFERSLEMDPDQPETRATYAMMLRMCGEEDAALRQLRWSVADPDLGVRSLCVAAQAYRMCGDEATARVLVRRAVQQHPVGTELRLLAFLLSELGMHREAADAVRLALQESPHDRTLLHIRAVELYRATGDAEQAEPFWLRILRIDPDDTIARFYHEAARSGKLGEYELDLFYEVPRAEFHRRLEYIADLLGKGMGNALECWKIDREFRLLLVWLITTGDENYGRAAMMVLSMAKDMESESILRELFYRGTVSETVKIHGLFFLRLRGADMTKMVPPDMNLREGMLPEAEDLLKEMQVCERQLVRFAEEVLAREYGVHALAALALTWKAYRSMCKGANDPLVCTQEAAAALAWNYLLQHGRKVSVEKLARQFECSQRRMVFYARRMATVLENYGGLKDHEDH